MYLCLLLQDQISDNFDILIDDTGHALQSRQVSEMDKKWRDFETASQKNKRGPYIRSDPIPHKGPYPMKAALEACKLNCEKRDECCNICAKKTEFRGWRCYLYRGQFGQLPPLEIEKASYRPVINELCAFRNVERQCNGIAKGPY